jgi:hypothetical protein
MAPIGAAMTPPSPASQEPMTGYPENQTCQFRWHRIFLRHKEKSTEHDGKAVVEEIRSGRAQARGLQGSQDQITFFSGDPGQ